MPDSFYFPCKGLMAPELNVALTAGNYRLHKVLRRPNVFDCASLGATHKVGFDWNWLQIFLDDVDCEIEVLDCTSVEEARTRSQHLQCLLYLQGLSPFTMPMVASHPISDYAGLNARDADREKGEGFRSRDGKIKIDIHEPAMNWIASDNPKPVEPTSFCEAAEGVDAWMELEKAHPPLATARHALLIAPVIYDLGSSLLMCWQGIEALFPSVAAEVRFRVSLLLAQLARPLDAATDTYERAKKSYDVRSRVAHGNFKNLKGEAWVEAWNLLLLAMQSAQVRNALPSPEVLTRELLSQGEEESGLGGQIRG